MRNIKILSFFFLLATIKLSAQCPPPDPASGAANPVSLCSPGQVQLSATGCTGIELRWYTNPGGGGPPVATGNPVTVTVSSTTTYYGFCYDALNDCQSANGVMVNVPVNTPPAIASILANPTTACPGEVIDLTATITPGTGTITTYSWSANTQLDNAANTTSLPFPSSPSETYTLIVTDDNNCSSAQGSVTVNSRGAGCNVTVSCSSTDPTTCGGSDGTATASATGGVPPYSYDWGGGITGSSVTGLSAGTYIVTVTDQVLTMGTCTVTLTDPISPIVTSIVANPMTACPGEIIDLTATITPGAGTVTTYSWSSNTQQDNAANTTSIPFPSSPSETYTLTVTDDNNCSSNLGMVTVNSRGAGCSVTVTCSGTDPTTCGGSDGTATASASGGVPPYSYDWGGGITGSSVTGLIEGTYVVTVTDQVNTTGTCTVTLSDPLSPTVASIVASPTTACPGEIIDLTATITSGAGTVTTYGWSANTQQDNASNTTSLPFPSSPSETYTLTVTDDNNCSSNLGMVTVNNRGGSCNVTVTCSGTDPTTCGGSDGTAIASASGGVPPYSFDWGGGLTGSSISGLSEGTYIVTVTDQVMATGTCTVTLTDPISPTVASIVANPTTACPGEIIDLTATITPGAGTVTTYSWSANTQQDNASNTTSLPFPSSPSETYTLTVTDDNNCSSNLGMVTVNNRGGSCNVAVTCSGTDPTTCGGSDGTAIASASGGVPPYSFDWGGGLTGSSISGLPAGTYTVTVTDQVMKTGTCTVTLTDPISPTVASIVANPTTACPGEIIDLTATITPGAGTVTTYSWSANTQQDNAASTTSQLFPSSPSETYTLIVTDDKNCTSNQGMVTVNNRGASCNIQVSCSGIDPMSCGASNGTVTANASGGVPPYMYDWGGGRTGPNISGLPAGTYTVTVTDQAMATGNCTVTLTDPTPPAGNIIVPMTSICAGDQSGVFSANVSNCSGCQYQWISVGGSPNNPNGSSTRFTWNTGGPKTVSLTITNSQNCSATLTAQVSVNDRPTLSPTSNGPVCSSGDLQLMAGGSGSSISYSWFRPDGTNFSNSQNPIDNSPQTGLYSVTAVNSSTGCSNSSSVSVTVYSNPTVSITGDNDYCEGENISLTAQGNGGSGGYSYNWSGPDNFTGTGTTILRSNATLAMDGNYFVTVTDGNNCQGESFRPVRIKVRPGPPMSNGNKEQCYSGVSSTEVLSVTKNFSASSVDWYDGIGNSVSTQTSYVPGNISAGLYEFNVKETLDGCVSDNGTSVSLRIWDEVPTANAISSNPLEVCENLPDEELEVGSNANWYFDDVSNVLIESNVPSILPPSVGTFYAANVTTFSSGLVCESLARLPMTYNRLRVPIPNYDLLDGGDGIVVNSADFFINSSLAGDAPITNILWDFGQNATVAPNNQADTVRVSFNAPGNYEICLQVFDSNSCESEDCFDLNVSSPNDCRINFTENQPKCAGTDFQINLTEVGSFSGGTQFTINERRWAVYDPDGVRVDTLTILDGSIPTFNYSQPGVYTFYYYIRDNNPFRCESSSSLELTIKPIPTISISAESLEVCEGQETTINFNASGLRPFDFTYSVNNTPFEISGFNDNNLSIPLQINENTVVRISEITAKGGGGDECINNEPDSSLTITALDLPQITNFFDTCFLTSDPIFSFIRFTIGGGNGGYTLDGNLMGNLSGNSFVSDSLENGTYELSISDDKGCIYEEEIIVDCQCDVDTRVGRLDTTSVSNNLCMGEELEIVISDPPSANPGDEIMVYYLHDGGRNFLGNVIDSVFYQNNNRISFDYESRVGVNQLYYLTGKLGSGNINSGFIENGCNALSNSIAIIFRPLPDAGILADPVCVGQSQEIYINTSIGTGPFNYSWELSDGSTQSPTNRPSTDTLSLDGLDEGSYIFKISVLVDSFGCTSQDVDSITLVVNPKPSIDSIEYDRVICSGDILEIIDNSSLNTNHVWDVQNQEKRGANVQFGNLLSQADTILIPIYLSMENSFGCKDTFSDALTFRIIERPEPTIQRLDELGISVCDNTFETIFYNNSSKPGTSHFWNLIPTGSGQIKPLEQFGGSVVIINWTNIPPEIEEVTLELTESLTLSNGVSCLNDPVETLTISVEPNGQAPDTTEIFASQVSNQVWLVAEAEGVCYQWGVTESPILDIADLAGNIIDGENERILNLGNRNNIDFDNNSYWVDIWGDGLDCDDWAVASCKTRSYYNRSGDLIFTGVKIVDKEDLSVLVYPNPNKGSFFIRVNDDSNSGSPFQILIHDELGNRIYREWLYPDFNDNIHIELENYTQGMHFIQVVSEKGAVVSIPVLMVR